MPLAVAVDGANVHDQKLVEQTLDAIAAERPEPTSRKKQHLCLDKGYTGDPVDRAVRRRGYIPHVPSKGTAGKQKQHPHGQARRWKVERTHSWVNRARRLLIRWEKKVANYLAFLHLQFAITTLRTAGVLG